MAIVDWQTAAALCLVRGTRGSTLWSGCLGCRYRFVQVGAFRTCAHSYCLSHPGRGAAIRRHRNPAGGGSGRQYRVERPCRGRRPRSEEWPKREWPCGWREAKRVVNDAEQNRHERCEPHGAAHRSAKAVGSRHWWHGKRTNESRYSDVRPNWPWREPGAASVRSRGEHRSLIFLRSSAWSVAEAAIAMTWNSKPGQNSKTERIYFLAK